MKKVLKKTADFVHLVNYSTVAQMHGVAWSYIFNKYKYQFNDNNSINIVYIVEVNSHVVVVVLVV